MLGALTLFRLAAADSAGSTGDATVAAAVGEADDSTNGQGRESVRTVTAA